jgi:hypothetical protein
MESRGMNAQIEADTGAQTGAVVVPDFQAVADIVTDGDDGKGPVEEDDIFQNSTEEFLDESITALQSPNNPRKVIDSLVSFETSEQID